MVCHVSTQEEGVEIVTGKIPQKLFLYSTKRDATFTFDLCSD